MESGTYENGRRKGKSAAAFRTISEVADDLDVPPHVLRFWETKFKQVRPLKRGGGRRYYRPEDIALLRRIRELLYSDGYTIKGVQRLLRDDIGRTQTRDTRLESVGLDVDNKHILSNEIQSNSSVKDGKLGVHSRAEISKALEELVFLKKRLDSIRG
ncbi:MAG: transcriptional regulator [Rhodospirillaceae bacterium]|nr:transcriptional regulator [Rhodospirillaceae bacterium]